MIIESTSSSSSPKSTATISVAVVPATVVPPVGSVVLLPHGTSRSFRTVFIAIGLPWGHFRSLLVVLLLPARNKLCSSWFQTRAGVTTAALVGIRRRRRRSLQGRPSRELRNELLETLMATGPGSRWTFASAACHLRSTTRMSSVLFAICPSTTEIFGPARGIWVELGRSSQWRCLVALSWKIEGKTLGK